MVAFHPPSSGKAADGTTPEDTTWIMARIVKSHQDKYRYVLHYHLDVPLLNVVYSYDVEDIEPQEDGKPLYVTTITIEITLSRLNSFVL
jgi:hypothetical protein